MNRTILTLLSLAFIACGPETPSGPDWSKLPSTPDEPTEEPKPEEPQPEEPKPEEPTIIMIEPTTQIAPANSDISNLRYYPGMQIDVKDDTFTTLLEKIAAAGFKYVELKFKYSYGLHNRTDEQVNETFASMQKQLTEKGVTVWSIHLPYEDKNWTSISASESIRKQSVEYILRALRLCATHFTSCKNYVLHASKDVSPSKTAISQAHKSLMEMDEVAKQLGVRFCVENLVGSFCFTIDDVLAVIQPFNNVYATYDIGHANCKGYDVVEFLSQIGTKLGTVHMHDTKFNSGQDTHELLGEPQPGITAWDDVIHTLLKTNRYRGVFMFELSGKNPNTVMASYNRIVGEYAAKYEK